MVDALQDSNLFVETPCWQRTLFSWAGPPGAPPHHKHKNWDGPPVAVQSTAATTRLLTTPA